MVDLDELKTQLTEFDALESKGYKPVSLDDLDLWQFEKYEKLGKEMGFRHVESGPLVRSSYHAEKHIL